MGTTAAKQALQQQTNGANEMKATSVKQARESMMKMYRMECDMMYFYQLQMDNEECHISSDTKEQLEKKCNYYTGKVFAIGHALESIFGVKYDTLVDAKIEIRTDLYETLKRNKQQREMEATV